MTLRACAFHCALLLLLTSSDALIQRYCVSSTGSETKSDPFHSCRIDGDFMVAGISPMRMYTDREGEEVDYERCDGNLADIYVLQSEAFLWYLNKASSDLFRRFNFTLGTELIDTCRSSDIGFQRSLTFTQGHPGFCHSNVSHNFSRNFPIAIMGGGSETALYINRLLEAYCIPFLSTEATSTIFSNRNTYPFFLRIVPPDKDQIDALVAMMKRFKWNHIGVIYEDTVYCHNLLQDLNSRLSNSHHCVDEARRNLIKTANYSRENLSVCIEWTFEVRLDIFKWVVNLIWLEGTRENMSCTSNRHVISVQ